MRSKGVDQFRFDATLPEGTRSWVVSNETGAIRGFDGNVSEMAPHNAVRLGALTWRIPKLIAALSDPQTIISSPQLVSTNQGDAYRIRVRIPLPFNDPGGLLQNIKAADYFIDASTWLIKIVDNAHPQESATESYHHELVFSDYRRVNGVLVPFSIVSQLEGGKIWKIQLDSISFNAGLSDQAFQF